MPVDLRTQGLTRRPVDPAEIRRRAERMLHAVGQAEAELSILLCDDAVIHALNAEYRHQDRPTDVLAFSMLEGEGVDHGVTLLGDVVISLDTARAQAGTHGRTIIGEVTFLLAHGLLHLLGYDHQTRDEERRMNARADVLFAAAVARPE